MSRRAALSVHFIALLVIGLVVVKLVMDHPPGLELAYAAALGWVGGILTDAWLLRPLTDWTMGRARA
jgi:hypothetical protein